MILTKKIASPQACAANAHAPGQERLKFVFFPLTWVLAHVGRTVEIAKALRDRGHEVVFAGADIHHPKSRLRHARAAGFRTVPVKEPNWPWAWERFEKRGCTVAFYDIVRHQKWAPMAEIMEDIVRVTREEKPDLILGDASLGVSPAGHITGVPAAGIFNAYNVEFYRPSSWVRLGIEIMDRMYWGPIRNTVYQRHGAEPISGYDLWHRTLMFSPDLPELFPPLPEFPNWHAIGPIVSEPPCATPEWFDELRDGKTNIYISMGSTGFLEQFLDRMYPALARAPYRFIVTTGGQVGSACIRRAPANFRFAEYAPGAKLLERSAAFVFHGGNGSMYQALGVGVPMLALPSHNEQRICAQKLVEQGCGRMDSVRRITGPRLLEHIAKLIKNPHYRANCWRHRHAVANTQAVQRAADLLEARAMRGRGVVSTAA